MDKYEMLKQFVLAEFQKKVESLKPEEMYGLLNILRDDGIIRIDPETIPDYVFACENCEKSHHGLCVNDLQPDGTNEDQCLVMFENFYSARPE